MKRVLKLTDIAEQLPHKILGKHPEGAICWIDFNFVTKYGAGLANYKPVLRPMSDLTKEIIHKGEKFVPLDRIRAISRFFEYDECGMLFMRNGCTQSEWMQVFDKLAEWMFDIRGLIPAGLAIDVNTLEQNPYEIINLKSR